MHDGRQRTYPPNQARIEKPIKMMMHPPISPGISSREPVLDMMAAVWFQGRTRLMDNNWSK
ncbi:MAG TPA: hypothetical protein DD416_01225 [Rhodobacteraceae bacterium]|nr:hypothetical protein [Paracoccaceae bacterium]